MRVRAMSPTLKSFDEIKVVVAKVPDAQVMGDLDAAVAYAKASGEGDIDKLGITGFCWGGRITWLYVAHNPLVKAGVAWYGRLVGETNSLTPKNPIDVASGSQSARAGPLRRRRSGHSRRHDRPDACSLQAGREDVRNRRL